MEILLHGPCLGLSRSPRAEPSKGPPPPACGQSDQQSFPGLPEAGVLHTSASGIEAGAIDQESGCHF